MRNSRKTDLLIVGAGPAGLMAACWASRLGIKTIVLDDKPHRTLTGHADGVHSRTLEIFDSFGIGDPILRKGVLEVEMAYWGVNPDSNKLECQHRTRSQPSGLSRFEQVLLNQGEVEQIMLDYVDEQGKESVKIEREKRAENIYFTDDKEYPVSVEARSLRTDRKARSDGVEANGDADANVDGDTHAQGTETIQARYVVACDGAKSTIKRKLGVEVEAKSTDSKWGVIDIVPITDFPDIRQSCAIHSDQFGSIMTAPRENRLVRFYIQLSGDSDLEKKALEASDESPDALIDIIQKIIHPYNLSYKICDWWSIYPIKQGLVKNYHVKNRVFLAGDAAHTHSPKAGQGMNVSIQDTYNLMWKLGLVIKGVLNPKVLQTYESERRPVAEELMRMDKELVHAYEQKKASISEVSKVREGHAGFMAGVEVTYPPNVLVAEGKDDSGSQCDGNTSKTPKTQKKKNSPTLKLGMRLKPVTVVNQADGHPMDLSRAMPSTGAWRVLVFAGDLQREGTKERITEFADMFSKHPRLSGAPGKQGMEIEVIMIHAGPRTSVSLMDLPEVFRPFDEDLGWDYGKVLADDGSYGRDCGYAYEEYGIDKEEGCLVLCRPDQHVSFIGRVEDVSRLDGHFAGFYALE